MIEGGITGIVRLGGETTVVTTRTGSRDIRYGFGGIRRRRISYPVVSLDYSERIKERIFQLQDLLDPEKSNIDGITADTGVTCEITADEGTIVIEKKTRTAPAVVSRLEGDTPIVLGELLNSHIPFTFSHGMNLAVMRLVHSVPMQMEYTSLPQPQTDVVSLHAIAKLKIAPANPQINVA